MPRRSDAIPPPSFEERNREIGSILGQVRRQENRTQEDCARILGTTRRRYGLIERGETPISAVELEALMRFLNVPAQMIWGDLVSTGQPRQYVVHAQPGESVQLVVQVRK
jgi:transcriptional regulator with XRE-family HTH domain